MKKKNLPLSRVYSLIEPGPIVLLTTAQKGLANVMTLAWHTMIDFEPPLIGCVVSENNYSFAALKATKQCVLNIPTLEIAQQVVGCGNASGAKVNKFEQFSLTPEKSALVEPPRIAECFANIECKVIDARWAGKYNFFILEAVKAWIDPAFAKVHQQPRTLHHLGKEFFMVAGETITLPSKMK